MKSFKFIVIVAIIVIMAACKSGDIMTPTSEKIQGPLGEYFEVVQKNYKAKDGKVSIEIKRIKEGFPFPWKVGMEVGYSDGQFEPHFTVEFQDSDGNVVSKDKTDIVYDKDELNVIANLGLDESATITFECKEGASRLKIGSTFKSHSEELEDEKKDTVIGKGESDEGDYSWLSQRLVTDNDLYGLSEYELSILRNAIYAMHGYKFKRDDLRLFFSKFSWYNGTKTDVSAELNTIEQKNVSKIKAYESRETSTISDSYGASGSGWDECLNQYEKYVNMYITYLKKAAKGDMSALAEYPSLMEKAQEFSDKMSGAKGEMSASQWARYMKITNKMATAAQEIQ